MLYAAFDPLYLIMVLPALALAVWAQTMVSNSFKKYSQQMTQRGLTGADTAARVLRESGVYGVRVESVAGKLTDHYDPKHQVIRLSAPVYGGASVAAASIAAHEAGHAAQHAEGYWPVKVRGVVIPAARFGSQLSIPLIFLGYALGMTGLINLGILLFGLLVLLQLVTLPVEFNASGRALRVLTKSGVLAEEELPGARRVLRAAALTYVAGMAVSLMQLLRFILLSRRGSR